MIYKDLNEIPLQRFIDVFFGEYCALIKSGYHSNDELSKAANVMICEYMSIVGGRHVLSEISKKNEVLNLSAKIECMMACKNLIKIGRIADVSDVLLALGYKVDNDINKIKNRVENILGNSRFRLDSINNNAENRNTPAPDVNSFVRERVLVMQHYKMHIDPMVFTAGEYAYMVKGMCEEMDRMSKNKK